MELLSNLNPEFTKNVRLNLPRRRALFIGGLTVALVCIVGWLMFSSAVSYHGTTAYDEFTYADQKRFGEGFHALLTIALVLLCFAVAPASAALSFIQEKLRGTGVFQQMVLLSPRSLATGKFFGSALISYFVAALLLPFYLFAAAIGDVGIETAARTLLYLFFGGLCCQAVAFYVSAKLGAPSERHSRGGLLAAPVIGAAGAIAGYAFYFPFVLGKEMMSGYRDVSLWHFFGVPVAPFFVLLVLSVFLGAWAFAGSVREVKASRLARVSSRTVWLFIASWQVVIVGLLWGYSGTTRALAPLTSVIFYLAANWAMLALLAGGFALDRNRLREWRSADLSDVLAAVHRREISDAIKTYLFALGSAVVGLGALWTSFFRSLNVSMDGRASVILVAVALSFVVTMIAMGAFVQFCAMYRFRAGAWAGVALTIMFYMITAVGAAISDTRTSQNVLTQINPLIYTNAVAVDEHNSVPRTYYYSDRPTTFNERRLALPLQPITQRPSLRALLLQGLLASFAFGLMSWKWRRTRDEMLKPDAEIV